MLVLGAALIGAAPVLAATQDVILPVLVVPLAVGSLVFVLGRAILGLSLSQVGQPPRRVDVAISVGTASCLLVCLATDEWWIAIAYLALVLGVVMTPELWSRASQYVESAD